MWKRIKQALGSAFLASAIVGTVLAYPLWKHHDIRLDSPTFASKAGAEAWLQRFNSEGEGAQCLDWSRDTQVIDQGYGNGWFVDFRCNTSHGPIRVAVGYAAPFILVLVLAYLLSSQRVSKKKRR